MLQSVGEALWFYLPVICCNVAVHTVWYRLGLGLPVDGHLHLRGRRLIGDSRGIEGFVFWIFLSCLIATLQGRGIDGLYLGTGGFAGTLVSSIVKRRINIQRGAWCPVLDETDYILGATLFYSSYKNFPVTDFLYIFFLSLFLHKLVNLYVRPNWENIFRGL